MFGFHGRHGRHEHRGHGDHGHHGERGHGGRDHDNREWGGMRAQFEAMRGGPRGGRHGHGGDDFGEGFGFGEALGFGRGGRGGGRGGRGGGRFFDHGDLKLVILALVAGQPRHGYEIIKAIEDMTGGTYSPSPGVIYPTLTLLEDMGHVTVEVVTGNRKQAAITEAGRAFLAEHDAEVKVIFARMEAAANEDRGPEHPSLIRAMGNLRLAMRLRFARGGFGPESIAAIASALDEAAAKIERS